MSQRPLPDFRDDGLLPVITGEGGELGRQSPYSCTPSDLRERFGHSERRLELIEGLFRYRADLKRAGFRLALQWLSGSFVERDAEPADIDVVNFGLMPSKDEQENREFVEQHRTLFYKEECRSTYGCDPAFILLSLNPVKVVQSTTYWTTLFTYSKQHGKPRGFVVLSGGPEAGNFK